MNQHKALKVGIVAVTVLALALATAFIAGASHFTVTVTVDPVGTVNRIGEARISGTITCSAAADYASVQGELRQIVGRGAVVSGWFGGYAQPCGPTPTRWSSTLTANYNALFSPGQARVNINWGNACVFNGHFYDCVSIQPSSVVIRLRGTAQ